MKRMSSSCGMIIRKMHDAYIKISVKYMTRERYADFLRDRGMHIGKGCDISKSIIVTEPWLVWLGNNVRLTRNVQLITHDGSLWTLRKLGLIGEKDVLYGKIVIEDNTNIGWDVKVLPGVRIGKNCIVGAGSIITKDIPDNTVAAGVPARVISTIEDYANRVNGKQTVFPTLDMTEKKKREYVETHYPIST